MKPQFDDIHALVDGELDGQEKAEALKKLQNCRFSQAEHEWAHIVKECLHQKCPRHDSQEVFSQAMIQVKAVERTRRTEAFVGRYSWAAASIVVAAIVCAALFNRLGGGRELAPSNVASLLGSSLIPIPGGEQDAQGTLESTFGRVPCEIQPRLIRVRDVANGVIEGKRMIRVRAMDDRGQLVLLVIEGAQGVEGQSQLRGDYSSGLINGANSISWTEGGLGFVILGSRKPDDLTQVADLIRSR